MLKLLSKNPSSQAKPVAYEARIKWFCTTFLLFVELGLPSGKHKCLSIFELTSGSGPSKKASEKTLLDKDSMEPSQLHFRCHHTLQLLLVRNFLLFLDTPLLKTNVGDIYSTIFVILPTWGLSVSHSTCCSHLASNPSAPRIRLCNIQQVNNT